jgi:hypothetical protein
MTDLDTARQHGHTRAKDAADHANRVSPQWIETAVCFVRLFSLEHRAQTFLAEDVRAAAESWGLSAAPDGRSWGHVMKRAEREGFVVPCGYRAAVSSRGSPKVLWRAA